MTNLEALLLLPHLRVQNVNAISSPMTWGFPSPSAFTGFVHALHRRIAPDLDLALEGVGIICHRFEPQVSQPSGKRNKVFHLTRNPVDKNGGPVGIVEEGRAHIEVSLVIGVAGDGLYSGLAPESLASRAYEVATSMRLAGGSVFASATPLGAARRPSLHMWPGTEEAERQLSKRLARRLLPGFALVSRERLLKERWERLKELRPDATALDALLDLSSLNIDPPEVPRVVADAAPAEPAKVEWKPRKKQGWIVPIPAGYGSLSEVYSPGDVKNTRDRTTPFRFVEGLYTVGQWLSPLRVDDVRKLLWFHQVDGEVYRWTTPHFSTLGSTEGN